MAAKNVVAIVAGKRLLSSKKPSTLSPTPVHENLARVLGSPFMKALRSDVILSMGKTQYSKLDLARMGIVQTMAARILSHVAKELGAKDVKDFYDKTNPFSFIDPELRVGTTTLYVLFRVFESSNLSVEDWFILGEKRAMTTFAHFKHRELLSLRKEQETARSKRGRPAPKTNAEILAQEDRNAPRG